MRIYASYARNRVKKESLISWVITFHFKSFERVHNTFSNPILCPKLLIAFIKWR